MGFRTRFFQSPFEICIRRGGKEGEMKVWVDRKVCLGDEMCVTLCPEIFAFQGHAAVAKTKIVPEGLEDACMEAAESCPGEAILVIE